MQRRDAAGQQRRWNWRWCAGLLLCIVLLTLQQRIAGEEVAGDPPSDGSSAGVPDKDAAAAAKPAELEATTLPEVTEAAHDELHATWAETSIEAEEEKEKGTEAADAGRSVVSQSQEEVELSQELELELAAEGMLPREIAEFEFEDFDDQEDIEPFLVEFNPILVLEVTSGKEDALRNVKSAEQGRKEGLPEEEPLCDEPQARQDPFTMLGCGFMHVAGDEVVHSFERAMEHYLRAADKGNAEGQFSVALFYMTGTGTQRDIRRGLAYLKMAVNQDHEAATALWPSF